MTASEQFGRLWRKAVVYLTSLNATDLALNVALTLIVIAVASTTVAYASRLLEHHTHRLATGTATKQLYIRRVLSLSAFILKVALFAFGLYIVALVWGFDPFVWASTAAGRSAVNTLLRVLLILLATVFGNELVRYLVTHGLEHLASQTTDPRRAGQINTLAPLLRGLAQGSVLVVAILMLLGELGVQIGPLIAGAGVIGIAFGFGAQTLVKDFLTGVFLIVEDVVSIGDVVNIASSGGLVEKMTLRTIQLRDFDGTLHVFPYSEAQVVHNLTKSFSYYVFNLQVSYESDIDRAMDVMRRVGDELRAAPTFCDKILAPIEVVGVDGFAASGINLKARIKTKPIEQWNVGREYNRRIKRAFDHEGISMPYPHIQLVPPADKPPASSARD